MPDSPTKGCFDGECNRADCQTTGARHYNFRTHAYYCAICARKIDIDEAEPTQRQCFDYPQRPDDHDRHKALKREKPYAAIHPDKKIT